LFAQRTQKKLQDEEQGRGTCAHPERGEAKEGRDNVVEDVQKRRLEVATRLRVLRELMGFTLLKFTWNVFAEIQKNLREVAKRLRVALRAFKGFALLNFRGVLPASERTKKIKGGRAWLR
jgi:hypothetical protein